MPLIHRFWPSRRMGRQRRGATLVEFAICLPVLLVMVLGSVELCRLNMLRHGATQAAYEAARRGMVPGATAAQVRTTASDLLNALMVSGYTVDISPSTISQTTPQVTVTITVPLAQNSWVAPYFCTASTMVRSFTIVREDDPTVTVP
jgi:Flp pilus assembly protein TadG